MITVIVRGNSFKVRNHLYVVLVYESKEKFGDNFEAVEEGVDEIDVLTEYVKAGEDGVTLVFAKSIRQAEQVACKYASSSGSSSPPNK